MAVFGNVGPFNEAGELFEDYFDRLEAFMKINKIKEESQSSLFLATMGPSTYKTLKNLCSPSLPGDKSYEELKNMLKEHFD